MALIQKILFSAILFIILLSAVEGKKQKSPVVTDIEDIKEFKKLLRTKTNVLVLFLNNPKASQPITEICKQIADIMKGEATLVILDCSNSSAPKKLCKKLKVPSEKNYHIKHYKNGEFHKDYDRKETLNSIMNFLRDPSGELPWDEDPSAADIFHLQDAEGLLKFLTKGEAAYKKSLIMFYAPWCGYCKSLKPDYIQAAVDLKGEALLAAMDVSKQSNSKVRKKYNITGFPTLLYFEKGQYRFPYKGDNKKQAIVNFMKDPVSNLSPKKVEKSDESWDDNSDVVHLTLENFDSTLEKFEHALVVFYAPWCGHCKRIKPELEKAATKIKNDKGPGLVAAVDATKEEDLASRFSVNGYPTLKYFHKGTYKYDASHARQERQIIDFLKDPREPPPPPPAEVPWADQDTPVRHFTAATIKTSLKKIKHALVMFYAPWCGHCKKMKPEFIQAAEHFSQELMVLFGAVDCTTEKELCSTYNIQGYPTIKYFSYFDKTVLDYNGDREKKDLVSFIHSQMGHHETAQKEDVSADAGFGINVVVSTDKDFEHIISSPKPTFVMFHASWCPHCVAIKPSFSKLATRVKSENLHMQIIAVDASDNPKVADIANVQTLPTFKMYQNGKLLSNYEGDRSLEDMTTFCMKYAKQKKDEL